jgi:hypothetical protein
MKRCCSCNIEKQETEFNKNRTKRDGLQIQCRDCSKDQSKDYYKRNKKTHSVICARQSKRLRDLNKERILNYLSFHPCVDCGEIDVVVLDFDHVREEKFKNVSSMVSQGYSWTSILEEIKKCDVRCANDHRRRTHERRILRAASVNAAQRTFNPTSESSSLSRPTISVPC